MSQEIVDAVRALGREKGISEEKLMTALEDALLSAYKKTPGSARYARVRMDRDDGEFRVEQLIIPEELEDELLDQVEEEASLEEGGRRVDPETGEIVVPEAPDIPLDRLEEHMDVIYPRDVTPEGFGRIAAQTAKQVILHRIREEERRMMYDEYIDRVGEVVTGIVQQAGDRNNVLVDLGKVESLLPRSEQVDGERYEQGSRIKAVITEVRSGTKGPQVILS